MPTAAQVLRQQLRADLIVARKARQSATGSTLCPILVSTDNPEAVPVDDEAAALKPYQEIAGSRPA